jgi:hypothetical protein
LHAFGSDGLLVRSLNCLVHVGAPPRRNDNEEVV